MKRIINGVAYNTDTATMIATGGPEVDDPYGPSMASWTMYRTRHGAFFMMTVDHDGETCKFEPFDDATAQAFLEKYANHLVDELFGPFPDLGAAERRLTVRIPANLASRLESAAEAKGLSTNSYAMRCFERCLKSDGYPMASE